MSSGLKANSSMLIFLELRATFLTPSIWHHKENPMRKTREPYEEMISASGGRVLARVLAEDLRRVKGGDDFLFVREATRTDPPPGYDVTFAGSDSI